MTPLLQLQNIHFAYRGNSHLVLHNVNLEIAAGEFVGIAGPTGAGKSTLVRCAMGIVPKFFKGPFKGEVKFRGQSIADQRVAELAGRIGVLFQDFEAQLFSTNARIECAFGMENLGVDRETMTRRIATVAKLVGVDRLLEREPQSLSGGQKQRLALASVLCLEPQVLLCDEPTTDLDPVGRQELFTALGRLFQSERSVVVVEHETERFVHADRVIILDHGQIVAEGRPDQVLADPDFCLRHGALAPQMFELAARLGLAQRPASIEDAQTLLQREGFLPSAWTPADESASGAGGSALVEVDDLHFAYPAGDVVLQGVDLTINRGDLVALLGQNGSGKTTLVKHLNALLAPDRGQVRFDRRPVTEIGVAKMGAKVGFVFQNPDHMLFNSSVFDEVAFSLRNMRLPEKLIVEKVEEALDAVGLSAPRQLDPFIMTKGERQKLAVACVLACDPEVLVLDEPTTGLDAAEQISMMQLLTRLNHTGRTIIIVTHALDMAAAYARRVVVMNGGRIIADGPTRRIFHQTDLLACANLLAPPCIRLGALLGIPALTVEELAAGLRRRDS
mgnify:CR=1 FL=1